MVTLTNRQQEIIKEMYQKGKLIQDIAYHTGIDRRNISKYLDDVGLRQIKKIPKEKGLTREDVEMIIDEKLQSLKPKAEEPVLLSLKALGYEFKENDKKWYLYDDMGNSKKTIQFANNKVHIRTFDKAKREWPMPYSISYDEIEAMCDEITKG